MKYNIESITEKTDISPDVKFIKHKQVKFTVNDTAHTIDVSMPDFKAGKTGDIVKEEADKIISILKG